MKSVLLFFLTVSISSTICAQVEIKPLELMSNFSGLKIIQNGKRIITLRQAEEIMRPVPQAYSYLRKARMANVLSSAMGFTGGVLIGWPLGTAVAGGKPKWELAIVGAGLIGVSIPLSIAAKKNASKAVDAYNISETVATRNIHTKFAFTENGIGLVVGF